MQSTENPLSPSITVVIPAFNEAKYLPLCLEALNKQTYPHDRFSILVVDNNSTDQTAEIAIKAGASVVPEKNQGYVYALNRGLQSATGDIIAVTDSDTKVNKDWLALIAKAFSDPNVVGITGSIKLDTASPVKNWMLLKMYELFLNFNFACNKPHFAGPNMAVRRSAFKQMGSIDLRYKISGDVVLGMSMRKYGKVKYVKELLAVTSSRRFKKDKKRFMQDLNKYISAYFYAIWLEQPPKGNLTPVR